MAQVRKEKGGRECEADIIDCPICLEHFRIPKSLPCLHTFCQECLTDFIIASQDSEETISSFECPVCRQDTQPKTRSSAPLEWAGQFPTNNFVLEMLELKNKNKVTNQYCQSCINNGSNMVSANFWCRDCEHFLCNSCRLTHLGHDVVQDHNELSVEKTLQQKSTKPYCEKHNKMLNMFCVDHKIFCCHSCVAMEHGECKSITMVTEYANSIRGKLTEIHHEADGFVKKINELITKSRENLDSLTKDKDSALKALAETQRWFVNQQTKMAEQIMKIYKDKTANEHCKLDEMAKVHKDLLQTKELISEAHQDNAIISACIKAKSEMSKLSKIVINKTECKESTKIVLQFKDTFEKLKSSSGGIGEVFVEKSCGQSQKLQHTVQVTKSCTSPSDFQAMEDNTSSLPKPMIGTSTISSAVQPLPDISTNSSSIFRQMTDVSTTSSIVTTVTDISTPSSIIRPLVESATSITRPIGKPMFGRGIVKIGFISVRRGNSIRGMIALSSGDVILSNSEHKEVLNVREDGAVLDALSLEDCPWDVCQMPDDKMGVSLYRAKRVSVIRISSSQLSLVKNIQLRESPWGIAYFNGFLFVSSLTVHKVLEDGQLKKISTLPSNSYHLSSNDSGIVGSLVQSNPSRPALYRLSHGNIYSEVVKATVVKKAYGIDTDMEGNLYLCGYDTNNVVQISADGSKFCELMTSDEISQPYQISICGDKLYLNKLNNNIIHIYRLE